MMKNLVLTKFNTIIYSTLILLLFIVFLEPFHTNLIIYLEKQITSITLNLSLLIELKAFASTSSSSHLPLISGTSVSIADTLSTAIHYLSWSDILVTAQLILITLSKSIILKITLIIALVGSFISKYRILSLKLIVLLLFINPGLPAYVSGVKYLTKEAKLDLGTDLTQELQNAHANYNKRVQENKSQEETRNQIQLKKVELEGKSKVSSLKRLEDKASDDIKKVDDKVIEGISDAYQVLKGATKEITIKSINLLTSILIQFILLPFLYFFGFFTLYKKFVSAPVAESYLEKLLICESAIILLLLTLSFT